MPIRNATDLHPKCRFFETFDVGDGQVMPSVKENCQGLNF